MFTVQFPKGTFKFIYPNLNNDVNINISAYELSHKHNLPYRKSHNNTDMRKNIHNKFTTFKSKSTHMVFCFACGPFT